MPSRTITFDYDGTPVEVTYNRRGVSEAYVETAQGFARAKPPDNSMFPPRLVESVWASSSRNHATVRALAAVIESWDITNDDGSPYPPTLENLTTLPLHFLGHCGRCDRRRRLRFGFRVTLIS